MFNTRLDYNQALSATGGKSLIIKTKSGIIL